MCLYAPAGQLGRIITLKLYYGANRLSVFVPFKLLRFISTCLISLELGYKPLYDMPFLDIPSFNLDIPSFNLDIPSFNLDIPSFNLETQVVKPALLYPLARVFDIFLWLHLADKNTTAGEGNHPTSDRRVFVFAFRPLPALPLLLFCFQ